MKTKHTSGKWISMPLNHKDLEGQFEIFVGDSDQEYMIAKVFPAEPYIGPEQSKANAKLITASPKILEALTNLVNAVSGDTIENLRIALVDAKVAIKTATE